MRNGVRQQNGQILYYWLVLDGDETAGELFSVPSRDAATVVRLVRETVQDALPVGTHRIAVSCVRGDASAFVVWSGDMEVVSRDVDDECDRCRGAGCRACLAVAGVC